MKEKRIEIETKGGDPSPIETAFLHVPTARDVIRQAWETFAIVCDMMERSQKCT